MDSNPLPLFPLPVVLFPGTVIPLHIFEPRYREMVSHVMEGDQRFGLIYHDPDLMGPFMNEPGQVGTVALIKKHQLLPDGRSLILVQGRRRFRILEACPGPELYYKARVERYSDDEKDPTGEAEALMARREASIRLFKQVVQAEAHAPEGLPTLDPARDVSFLLAAAARMDRAMQQELLETRSEIHRLDRLDPVFRFGIGKSARNGHFEA